MMIFVLQQSETSFIIHVVKDKFNYNKS